jgi:hypothetical protein
MADLIPNLHHGYVDSSASGRFSIGLGVLTVWH